MAAETSFDYYYSDESSLIVLLSSSVGLSNKLDEELKWKQTAKRVMAGK
mgnify:CR=1 FL=1